VLITGANRGCGYETALALARAGAGRVIMAVRDQKKGQEAKARIEALLAAEGGSAAGAVTVLEVLECDVSSFASIRAAVRRLVQSKTVLDVFVNNAGAVCDEGN
jgi:NAD(P)-dependent dehydrogenase (short-subunit alcohol dehydrogenase family)